MFSNDLRKLPRCVPENSKNYFDIAVYAINLERDTPIQGIISLMDNNEILSRIQTIFEYDIAKLITIFGLGGLEVTPAQLNAWLSDAHEEIYVYMEDEELSHFLNGLITEKRGKKDDSQPKAEDYLTNNIIFKKLRIAFNLKTEDILEILEQAEIPLSKYELSAIFRREDHRNYRNCKNNVLRGFLKGLEQKQS